MSLDPYRVTVNFPAELKEELQARWQQLGYPSMSAWVTGLAIFDLYCDREHKVTLPLMKEPAYIRDKILVELKERLKDPNLERPGGWFDRLLKKLIEEERQRGATDDDKGK